MTFLCLLHVGKDNLTATHALQTEILNKPFGRRNGFTFMPVFTTLPGLLQSMPRGRGMCCFSCTALVLIPAGIAAGCSSERSGGPQRPELHP